MNHFEAGQVLLKCSAFDQRTIGEGDIAAWQEVLADAELQDALAAVTAYYRTHTKRIMPADIIGTIKDMRGIYSPWES